MGTIEQTISGMASEILEAWAADAQRSASGHGLSRPELMNIMPKLLAVLARSGSEAPRRAAQMELVHAHLSSRLRAGFDLDEVLEEFAILGRVIVRICSAMPAEDRPHVEDVDRVLADIHAATVVVTQAFREYLDEDEQAEKRFLRLLSEPFLEPDAGRPPLCPERLQRALAVVMAATGADTAALLLHDARTGELVMSASVGTVGESFARYVRMVDASSFVGTVAEHAHPTTVNDVATTSLDVPDELRHSGIHAVLGIRLPAQRRLLGVLYIGMRATRTFSAREVRRLEAIGEGLSLHLDNARLYTELLEQLEALRIERGLRSQFVAVLAHDLRGPLSAARMAAVLLAQQPGEGGSRDRVGVVVRNLDRADRMVIDLLDVERIHAGKRLPLVLADHDLGALVREVLDELAAEHPGRVLLHVEEGARGRWDASALRRTIWNLVSNALKYGAKEAPVHVSVTKHPNGAELRVHNEGAPIPAEVQATLFEPFTRAHVGGVRGWGLGLTLVRGTAEAHGGTVRVESGAGCGTTFTLRLPEDSSAAQRAA